MQLEIVITRWHSQCGDECCSDSDVDFECRTPGHVLFPEFQREKVGYNISTAGEVGSYLIIDVLHHFLKPEDRSAFRAKVFAAWGMEDKVTHWNWTSKLPSVQDDRIVEIFQAFDIEVTVDWKEEDR